jgi:putative ABC transport system permease protein
LQRPSSVAPFKIGLLGVTIMDTLIQDIRFALRLLVKNRGFTAVAVLTLALGIGANTAIFSLVNAVLLRQLPYQNPDQLVRIWSSRTDRDKSNFSLPDFMDYRDQNQTLQQISGFSTWSANLLYAGEPERIFGVRSSANIFQMLGVNAEIGRTLLSEDDDSASQRVVVLSHRLWSRRFGMSADIVGKQLTLNDENYTVVGVLRPAFVFPGMMDADLVVPLVPDADPLKKERGSISFLNVIGRVKDGVPRQEAEAEADLNAIAGRLQQLYPVANASKKGAKVIPLREELVGNFRLAFLVLSAAVGLVLLIACANLANLLLARASTRYREMTIRLAIGATRGRLIRQLLTENVLLSLLGGALGLVLAQPAMESIIVLGPASLPRAGEIEIDARVLLFTLSISLLSGALFGLVPTLNISRDSFIGALKGSGKGSVDAGSGNKAGNLLILSEVALSLLLLISAGLLAKSFVRLQGVSPGFATRNLLVMRLSLPKGQYSNPEAVTAFYEQLSARMDDLPGVESAGATSVLPLSGSNVRINFAILGRPTPSLSEQPITQYRMTGPDYFRTMKIPILSGRDFTYSDTPHSQAVAIISDCFARRYWPGASPIGAHIKIDDNNQAPREVEIIGVVGDVRHTGLHTDPAPESYVPISQIPKENIPFLTNNMNWVLRTSAEPMTLAGAVAREIQSVNDKVATTSGNMQQYLSSSLAPSRFNLFLLGAFAIAALILATTGIYAVISYSVTRRTAELGVRIAIGAGQRDVLKLVVGGSFKIVSAGVALGVAGAYILTRLLSSLLYGISVTDPSTFVSMPLLLIVTALLATYIPARRALKVDPVIAIRAE